jgi:toxin ParE1/3/4
MSQHVIVLDEAEDELIEGAKVVRSSAFRSWSEFRSAIDEAMERLLKAPLAASPIVNLPPSIGARRVLVKRFPYSIVFIDHDEDLWVVAFAHQHRRPGYWRERLKP